MSVLTGGPGSGWMNVLRSRAVGKGEIKSGEEK